MTVPHQKKTNAPRRRARNRATTGLALALALGSNLGCGREFFRQWADQDVSESVFEKSRDPRWRMDLFSIEPPAMSRFADPYDPDRPPAPPDDPAAQALSPAPQWPHHRLLTPQEGTGYNELLEAGPRYVSPKNTLPETVKPDNRPSMPPPPAPGASPFNAAPNSGTGRPALTPIPAGDGASPPALDVPGDAPPPNPMPTVRPTAATSKAQAKPRPSPKPIVAAVATKAVKPVATRAPKRDSGVQQVAHFQAPIAPPAVPAPSPGPGAPATSVGPQARDAQSPLEDIPGEMDPEPGSVDLRAPADRRNGLSAEAYKEAGRATAGLSALLGSAADVDVAEASGLEIGSKPYLVSPAQAVNLALMNSRAYQSQLENVYIAALPVTLQRFAFEPQFYAGLTPATGAGGVGNGVIPAGSPLSNFQNSFTYRTKEAPGGQASNLNLGTAAGVGKLFSNGGRLVAGFASQLIFNFAQKNGRQPIVQSNLPIQYFQPFLRGGGRAITLEPLTLAERQLLYQVRLFARFRQQFIPYVLTQGNPVDTTGAPGDPSTGYLLVIQQLQTVSNDRETVEAFERLAKAYRQFATGGGSNVSQLNVDTINNSLLGARQSLVTDTTNYRISLDNFKLQIGLPPDVNLVLDRNVLKDFRSVFKTIDDWFLDEERQPETLPVLVGKLPNFENVVVDGRSVMSVIEKERELLAKSRELEAAREQIEAIPNAESDIIKLGEDIRDLELATQATDEAQREVIRQRNDAAIAEARLRIAELETRLVDLRRRRPEFEGARERLAAEVETIRNGLSALSENILLAGERIALENRFDLMNARGQLYDTWCQLAVTSNALKGVFNVTLTNQIFTPPTTTNPFAFVDQAKQFSLIFNAELPLVRVNERNNFQQARINYRRQQRILMALEDTVKLGVRTELRQLIQLAQTYTIQKETLVINLRNKDNAVRLVFAPPSANDTAGSQTTANTQALVGAQTNILGAQNRLIATWVSYQTQRFALYRDLGIMPYDEWEAYYELFPSATGGGADAAAGNSRPAPAGPAGGGGPGAAAGGGALRRP